MGDRLGWLSDIDGGGAVRDLRQEAIDRLLKNPTPMRSIAAKCCECIYDPEGSSGTWRQQVEECTAPTCPLYHLRPKPDVRTNEETD